MISLNNGGLTAHQPRRGSRRNSRASLLDQTFKSKMERIGSMGVGNSFLVREGEPAVKAPRRL